MQRCSTSQRPAVSMLQPARAGQCHLAGSGVQGLARLGGCACDHIQEGEARAGSTTLGMQALNRPVAGIVTQAPRFVIHQPGQINPDIYPKKDRWRSLTMRSSDPGLGPYRGEFISPRQSSVQAIQIIENWSDGMGTKIAECPSAGPPIYVSVNACRPSSSILVQALLQTLLTTQCFSQHVPWTTQCFGQHVLMDVSGVISSVQAYIQTLGRLSTRCMHHQSSVARSIKQVLGRVRGHSNVTS